MSKPCESFRDARAGAPGSTVFLDVHVDDPACHHCGAPRSAHGPDVEACARAAYEAAHGGLPRYRWDAPEGDYSVRADTKEVYRAVARAVLAAAGVGR